MENTTNTQNFINVKEVLETKGANKPNKGISEEDTMYRYTKFNVSRGDKFYDENHHNPKFAFERLSNLRRVMDDFQKSENDNDHRDLPPEIKDLYEELWCTMRLLETKLKNFI